ncbi:Transcription factor iws1 [Friedmanniomyces endolithicus]|nr:Transcription factor iws1 [Friedmanniomyces endolithicus]KAK0283496.1 Transcription factor iws1 [Friedmanniomyces endolithicus]
MADLEVPPGSPAIRDNEEPEALNDPQDPLNSGIDEEHGVDAPLANPEADTEVFEDEEAAGMNGDQHNGTTANLLDDDDAESELEELDEKEFEDFDPSALNIPEKPVAVDADNVNLLGVHKRKRTEEEERERKKKRKEGRREKPKKARTVRAGGDDEEDFEGGPEMDGKRVRRAKAGADGAPVRRAPRARTPENEEKLSPEERRRRRALDRKMDEAPKSHRTTKRRRGGGIDLEGAADEEISNMRNKMAEACRADAEARQKGEVATEKIRILPEVVELLNKNTIQAQLVDPENNILEAVRFMLEPADHDAALPNYAIQKELFAVLRKMNMSVDSLKASGIGKVVLFYTKSIQPQADIKRAAERLIGEWMRVVLDKDKKSRRGALITKEYDPLQAAANARSSQAGLSQAERLAISREKQRRMLAPPIPGNRARADGGGLPTYTVAPVNNTSHLGGGGGQRADGGEAAVRRMIGRGASGAGQAGRSRR